jgi:PKD repeat protein
MFARANIGKIALFFCLIYGAAIRVRSQAVLDVTDFGARGEAVCFSVNTVSNSTVVSVAGTNRFSSAEIGKIIEVFRAGPTVMFNGGVVVTQQDIICPITNVANGTNLSLTIPCGWTTNAYCVVGANNAPAFQAAINAASNLVAGGVATNVTIQIPAGKYLLCSPQVLNPNYVMSSISDTHPAITVSSGGITFSGMGGSPANTILMGCGAGMEHLVGSSLSWISPNYAPYVPMRDTLVFCQGPVQNSQYPLVFENLTFDGGLTNGMQSYDYWTPIQADGDGWDTTHHAVADSGGVNNVGGKLVQWQMNQLKVFNDCIFQHWRGEMLICWTGDITNAMNEMLNCTFQDGNATADNMYYGQVVSNCVFNGLGKVMEYYEGNASLPTIFEDNVCSNIAAGNHYELTIVGAVTNEPVPSFSILNNVFSHSPGMSGDLQFSPAANVTVAGNSFDAPVVFTSAGVQPSDGSAIPVMTNFVFLFNTNLTLYADGYPISDVLVASNQSLFISIGGGWKDNWTLQNNVGLGVDGRYDLMNSAIGAGHYPFDATNNVWYMPNTPPDGGDYGATNYISYGNGRTHILKNQDKFTNEVFYLDDTKPNLIPVGAELDVPIHTWQHDNITNFYTSAVSPGSPLTLTNGTTSTFYWSGEAWVTNFIGAATQSTVQFTASPTNSAVSSTVQFSSPRVDSAGNAIVSWKWNFGDGSTSTAQNPSHTYTTTGTFNPGLVATNMAGSTVIGSGPSVSVGVSQLAIAFSAANVTLTWPTNVAGYTLEFTTNLAAPVWTPVSLPATVVNGQNALSIPMSNGQMYFRLGQ